MALILRVFRENLVSWQYIIFTNFQMSNFKRNARQLFNTCRDSIIEST